METIPEIVERLPDGLPALTAHALCANCDEPVSGKYCPACGQETLIETPTVLHFLQEFVDQYLALEGKLGRTLRSLLLKPGQLTLDYVQGRRQRYVRPLKLYLTISVLFFAALSITGSDTVIQFDDDKTPEAGAAATGSGKDKPAQPKVSVDRGANDGKAIPKPDAGTPPGITVNDRADGKSDVQVNTGVPALDARLKPRIEHFVSLPKKEMAERARAAFYNYAPYAMFVLLPLFALLLKIGYLRKHFNYAVHLLFALNYHSFVFFTLLVAMLPLPGLIEGLLYFAIPLYLVMALRRAYGGGWFGTSFFVFLLSMFYSVAMGIVMGIGTMIAILVGQI